MNLEQAKDRLNGVFQIIADDLNSVVESIIMKETPTILDIGTGDGKMAIILALNGYEVITGEPKDDETVYAQRDWQKNAKMVEADPLIKFKHFKVEDLPFDEETFDYIFSYGGFHHFNHKKKALREIIRVIKPNGTIAIIEPNAKMIERIQQKHPEHPKAEDPREYLDKSPVNHNLTELTKVDLFTIKRKL